MCKLFSKIVCVVVTYCITFGYTKKETPTHTASRVTATNKMNTTTATLETADVLLLELFFLRNGARLDQSLQMRAYNLHKGGYLKAGVLTESGHKALETLPELRSQYSEVVFNYAQELTALAAPANNYAERAEVMKEGGYTLSAHLKSLKVA